MQGFKRESCLAEKCKVLQNHEKVGALVMGKNAISPDQDNDCQDNNKIIIIMIMMMMMMMI